MKLRHLYVLFAVLGLVLPYSQFIAWIIEHHALDVSIFLRDLFANRISAFFAMDVLVSAIVLISFVQSEGKRLCPYFSSAFHSACRCFCICGSFNLIEQQRSNQRRPTASRTRAMT
jgi:hypothetical protein